ncbi:RHS repeat-associated core domain-containing protein [Orenia marismortui]|uniref:RHS repeat-associated protein n=1 Tax=Orenia marismortui TaxID=46469 RepID=A0A4R8H157_9FIRM|nr:RHS repeat-associated core domain-containing protein [Orenia marismortui]TDX53268.1 RHS repeat-associated protein [Orenia marismortui]
MTDTSAKVVMDQDYLPFGGDLARPNQIEVQNDSEERYKYTGQKQVVSIGLYYYGARYYDSGIGRFTREDSYRGELDDPQSQNVYIYVMNNPLVYIDPDGHKHIRHEDEFGVVTHEYTNLNITVFESAPIRDPFDPKNDTVLTGFNTNAYAAGKGEYSYALDKDGVMYFTVEDLESLDNKYKWKKLYTWGKFGLSLASDISYASGVAKGAIVNGTKGAASAAINGLKPTDPIAGSNFTVGNVENAVSDKNIWEKTMNFFKSFIPFKGTLEIGDEIIDKTTEPQIELKNE